MAKQVIHRDFRVEKKGDGVKYPPFDADPLHARAELKADKTGEIFYIVGRATKEPTQIVKASEFLSLHRSKSYMRIHWIAFPPRIGDRRYKARNVGPSFVLRFKGSA